MSKNLLKFNFSSIPKAFSFTKAHQQFYKNNGYLVLPNFIPLSLIDSLKSRTSTLIKDFEPSQSLSFFETNSNRGLDFLETGDKIHFFFEPDAIDPVKKVLKVQKEHAFNKMGHAMHDLDPVFKQFSYRKEFMEILKGVGYKRPNLCQSMYIFKSPKIGQEVAPHTDNTYLITSPLSCIGLWVALDNATLSNGCLWGVPGSHKRKTTHFMRRNPEATGTLFNETDPLKLKSYEIENGVPLEVEKGSVVLLHGDFVHYSKGNVSLDKRHAYTMHFVESEDAVWDKGNWLQRGKDVPFIDYYKEIQSI